MAREQLADHVGAPFGRSDRSGDALRDERPAAFGGVAPAGAGAEAAEEFGRAGRAGAQLAAGAFGVLGIQQITQRVERVVGDDARLDGLLDGQGRRRRREFGR